MRTIQTEISDQLDRAIEALVERGWFENRDQVLKEAVRRFVEIHQPALMERFARDDVEWGLRGQT